MNWEKHYCKDVIYIVKCIHQIIDEMKKPACILLIDLAAAFCHFDKHLVFKTVCQRQTPTSNTKLIQLMESPYSYTTTVEAFRK